MSIVKKSIELATERFSSSVWGYYNLWSYFDARVKHTLASTQTHQIRSCLEFYTSLSNGTIKHGDRIKLKNFFISEWVPRVSGGFAHLVNNKKLTLTQYNEIPTSFNPTVSKLNTGDLIPPFGSVRFPIKRNSDVVLSAVTAAEYHVDLGIVLAVHGNVYSEFMAMQTKNNSVEADVEGYVDIFNATEKIPSIPEIENSINYKNNLSVPTVVLRVLSTIQTKFRSNDSHPRFNAWFLRRKEYSPNRIVGLSVKNWPNKKAIIKKIYGDPIEYDYYNHTIFENNPDEILAVRELMKKDFLGLSVKGLTNTNKNEAYALISWAHDTMEDKSKEDYSILSVEHLTEFDGRYSTVQPLISFNADPRKRPTKSYQIIKEIAEIEHKL